MELHAESRVLAMGERHDFSLLAAGSDLERAIIRQIHDQGVIAPGLEGARQLGEQAASLMLDAGSATVHRGLCMGGSAAEGLADTLMAQANAENGQFAGKAADQAKRHLPGSVSWGQAKIPAP